MKLGHTGNVWCCASLHLLLSVKAKLNSEVSNTQTQFFSWCSAINCWGWGTHSHCQPPKYPHLAKHLLEAMTSLPRLVTMVTITFFWQKSATMPDFPWFFPCSLPARLVCFPRLSLCCNSLCFLHHVFFLLSSFQPFLFVFQLCYSVHLPSSVMSFPSLPYSLFVPTTCWALNVFCLHFFPPFFCLKLRLRWHYQRT